MGIIVQALLPFALETSMKPTTKRHQDITEVLDKPFTIRVDGNPFQQLKEKVSSVLYSHQMRHMTNDYGTNSGPYCGMGVCHCCLLHVNGRFKQRACQTLVKPDMEIETNRNQVLEKGKKHG